MILIVNTQFVFRQKIANLCQDRQLLIWIYKKKLQTVVRSPTLTYHVHRACSIDTVMYVLLFCYLFSFQFVHGLVHPFFEEVHNFSHDADAEVTSDTSVKQVRYWSIWASRIAQNRRPISFEVRKL